MAHRYCLSMWETIISALALALSGFALWRTRTRSPSWEMLGVVTESEPDVEWSPYGASKMEVTTWYALVRQNGPGTAEGVRASYRRAGGEWSAESALSEYVVNRGGEVQVTLCTGEKIAGSYDVKLIYRCLPNTARRREKVLKVEVA